ncbi:maleylpyruvate isomerase family mycothiol-dependent enzyme [Rhodococcus sp. NPDC058521]|uniref:maleylpyruvate isomerase family mycothiol-dependent enzyme n=1 Tax=Rhodococcus sp. NPDC058521 TaxID=3346536 RepID=UPI003647EDDD
MISDDDLQLLDCATGVFGQLLSAERLIGSQPSRCPGWSTHDVANHVLGGAIRYTNYFPDGDPSKIVWSRTAEHLGDDPRKSHDDLAQALRREFVRHRDDGIILHHPVQDVDAPTLLVMRVQELVIHAWDIASITDPAVEIEPALGRFLLDRGEPVRTILRAPGALGPETDPSGTGLTERVLAAWGRR